MPAAEPIYDYSSPNWAPLDRVVPADQAEIFIWMHGCVYADGFRLEAYKHSITRQYLYLSGDGSAYVVDNDRTLHLVDVRGALDAIGDRLEQLGWPRAATPADEAAHLDRLAARRHHSSARRRGRC